MCSSSLPCFFPVAAPFALSLSHSIWLSLKMLLTKQVDRHRLIKITIFLPIYFISFLSSSSDAIMAIQHGRSWHSKIILLCLLLMKLFKKWDQYFQPYEGGERSGGHLKCAWKKERDVKLKGRKEVERDDSYAAKEDARILGLNTGCSCCVNSDAVNKKMPASKAVWGNKWDRLLS